MDWNVQQYFSHRWRWDRILDITSGDSELCEEDDIHIRKGVAYLRKYNRGQRHQELAKERYPELHAAHLIYERTVGTPKWHIEAMTVSRASQPQIAGFMGLPNTIVDAYETYFFDVRDHLDNPGFIPKMLTGIECIGNDPDVFWKTVGYFAGMQGLYMLWQYGEIDEQTRKKIEDHAHVQVLFSGLAAVKTRRITQFNADMASEQMLKVSGVGVPTPLHLEDKKERPEDVGVRMIVNAISVLPAVHRDNFTAREPRAIECINLEEKDADSDGK